MARMHGVYTLCLYFVVTYHILLFFFTAIMIFSIFNSMSSGCFYKISNDMDSNCNKDIDMELVRVMMILIMILITTKTL